MTFKIKSISGSVIEIDSNIVPCCESGHGECETILESKIFGICCGDCGFPDDDSMGVDVFWWNSVSDEEFEIQDRLPSIKEIRLQQRKGSKEARAIVAMLAREYREASKAIAPLSKRMFAAGIETSYLKAKSMLK